MGSSEKPGFSFWKKKLNEELISIEIIYFLNLALNVKAFTIQA